VRLPAARLAVPTVLIAATVAVIVIVSRGSSYVVRAEFADAAGLQPNYTVKIDGVTVGQVASVTVTRRVTALATLDLKTGAGPIGSDATAQIKPSNLLGEKYVDLNPGDKRAPARSGSLIPLSRTATPPELDQLIDTFDPDTRRAVAIFLAEEGDALLGRGTDLAATLKLLPASLQSAQQLVANLGQDNQALARLIDQSDAILQDVAPRRAALGALITSASGAFASLASRDHELGQTVQAAPGTVAQVRQSLIALQGASGPLAQAASGLRSTAGPLSAALQALPEFTQAARPTLQTVAAVAPTLQRLANQATPVVIRLKPAASELTVFAHALAPVSRLLDTGIADVLGTMEGWARVIQDRDTAGHVFRTADTLPLGILDSLLNLYPGPPAAARRPPAAHPTVRRPARSAGRPTAANANASPTNPPSSAPPTSAPPGSTQQTLTGLLSYLLGK
jgi:virulence factor Mce-like protein